MAGMEQQFRDAMMAKPDAETPADAAGPMEEPEAQDDLVCPACGASAMKIAQAAQGGGAPPKGGQIGM